MVTKIILWVKQTHRLREQNYGYQGGRVGEGIVRESRIDMYTLLYFKWITNEDLLYSTGNYVQYLVITYNGKELKKRL